MTKNYTKNTWTDEVLASDERYNILDNGGSTLYASTQLVLATSVTQAGTAVDATKMNNIENGIDTIDTALSDRGLPHFLTSPLTSTSYDGDRFSSQSPTLLDLSVLFGAPANIKAVLLRAAARDSASAGTNNLYIYLSPTNSGGVAPLVVRPSGLPNDYWIEQMGIVPCTAAGDIYLATAASGSSTLAVRLEIWAYWL
jgi:hypothetical protein